MYLTLQELFFKRNFQESSQKIASNIKSRPNDIKFVLISNDFKEHEMQRAASLGQHTLNKSTQKQYQKTMKNFK